MDRFVIRQKKEATSATASTSETAGDHESDAVGPAAVGKRKREKTRKYTDSYLKFGFSFKETDEKIIQFPMCVICSTVLSNESMKPSKLQRHLETTHGHLKDKPVEYFQTLLSC